MGNLKIGQTVNYKGQPCEVASIAGESIHLRTLSGDPSGRIACTAADLTEALPQQAAAGS